jgi:ATP-binding cassette subfamily F protein 3
VREEERTAKRTEAAGSGAPSQPAAQGQARSRATSSRDDAGKPGTRAKAAKAAKATRGKPNARAQREIEREIEAAEAALGALEAELADPSTWSDPDRSAGSTARHAAAKRTIEELYARWERIAG